MTRRQETVGGGELERWQLQRRAENETPPDLAKRLAVRSQIAREVPGGTGLPGRTGVSELVGVELTDPTGEEYLGSRNPPGRQRREYEVEL